MENCIYNDNDNSTIGYCKDLKAGLERMGRQWELACAIR